MPATPDKADRPLPLDGIRVVEFCHTIMGPSCGLALADIGADVVEIEPFEGDRTRRLAGFFSCSNLNKRSIALRERLQAKR